VFNSFNIDYFLYYYIFIWFEYKKLSYNFTLYFHILLEWLFFRFKKNLLDKLQDSSIFVKYLSKI